MNSPENRIPSLQSILEVFDCQTGTLHRTDGSGDTLVLVTQVGVPEFLMDKISVIPFGKGIAGAAAARGEPVELCNLQQDLGGVAEANARRTGIAGSIAVPIFSPGARQVIGTLGIGKTTPYEFSEAEKQRLTDLAAEIAPHFVHKEV